MARQSYRLQGMAAWVLALIAVLSAAPASAAQASDAPAGDPSAAPARNPYAEEGAVPGSGAGKRIGYISLTEEFPFVQRVSGGIVEEAARAGADLIVCDAKADLSQAIVCGQQLADAGVQGVLNFQTHEDEARQVCEAYGGLPTIAIDIRQPPCEVSFFGVDNRRAGRLVGSSLGEHLRGTRRCEYDSIVVLGSDIAGATTRDRMDGTLEGFASVCGPIPPAKIHSFDSGVTILGDELMTTYLASVPEGGAHVVFAVNDDAALGALRAARALDRKGELWIGAHGADHASLADIACEPQWVADVAYFPERYGRTLIPAMIDILDGTEVPAELFTEHVAVTRDNIRELYPETPACPTPSSG